MEPFTIYLEGDDPATTLKEHCRRYLTKQLPWAEISINQLDADQHYALHIQVGLRVDQGARLVDMVDGYLERSYPEDPQLEQCAQHAWEALRSSGYTPQSG